MRDQSHEFFPNNLAYRPHPHPIPVHSPAELKHETENRYARSGSVQTEPKPNGNPPHWKSDAERRNCSIRPQPHGNDPVFGNSPPQNPTQGNDPPDWDRYHPQVLRCPGIHRHPHPPLSGPFREYWFHPGPPSHPHPYPHGADW